MITDLWTYVFYTLFGALFILGMRFILITRTNEQGEVVINYLNPGVYVFILFYSLVVGFRDNVGLDYAGYTSWYEHFRLTGKFYVENEIGFRMIIVLLSTINLPYISLFLVLAFFQIVFLILAINRLSFVRGWYSFFFLTCLLFFMSMNVMRQTIAYYIFFWGYFYFLDRKYLQYIGIILFGMLFHKTIVIPALVGVFLRGDIFKNRVFLIAFLFAGSFLLPLVLESFFKLIFPVADWLGYGFYIEIAGSLTQFTEDNQTGDGLGLLLFLIIDGLIIYYSDKMKEEFKLNYFIPFFNLFVIGAILSRAFAANFLFLRIAEYFINFRVLMLAFLCLYFVRNKKSSVSNYVKFTTLQSIVVILMLAFFYKAILNNAAGCRPWSFVFF